LRRASIPLGHITAVHAGSNLTVETGYGRFCSWAAEAAKTQVGSGDYGTQGAVTGPGG
jgi:hypothetical protein